MLDKNVFPPYFYDEEHRDENYYYNKMVQTLTFALWQEKPHIFNNIVIVI